MKTIIEYQCEICKKRYQSKKSAEHCEASGLPDTTALPIGLMYEYNHNGYVGIFAVASVKLSELDPHSLEWSSWAVRTSRYSPYSLDDEKCGSNDFQKTDTDSMDKFKEYYRISKSKVGNNEFTKMACYLKEKGITPFYYNEKKEKITVC